jgi:23S rRNA (adenine2030-N6)-methyltransferase
MLSYRHAFHAGSPADLLKHGTLVFCLDYFAQKEKPFFCADTHAGAGLYALHEGFAALNREWEKGLGRLLSAERKTLPDMLHRYLDMVTDNSLQTSGLQTSGLKYPGSPEIIRRMLRSRDKAVCFELHPADFAALTALLGEDRRITVRQEDGFAGLLRLLPPPSRRGIFLIDPSYEVKDDYRLLPEILKQAFRLFPTGTYIIWYPLLRTSLSPELPVELKALCRESRGPQTSCCRAELYTAQEDDLVENSPRGMYGSGLIIRNPPWTLKAALETSLPCLAKILDGDWMLEWEEA